MRRVFLLAPMLFSYIIVSIHQRKEKSIVGKIFTFQFTFEHEEDRREDEIQFCAHNLAEADGLFYFWAKHDQYEDITWIRFEVVYNQADADRYGQNYGKPEEYHR